MKGSAVKSEFNIREGMIVCYNLWPLVLFPDLYFVVKWCTDQTDVTDEDSVLYDTLPSKAVNPLSGIPNGALEKGNFVMAKFQGKEFQAEVVAKGMYY